LTYGDIERALTLTGEPSPEESGEGELLEPTTVALRGEILLAAGEIDRAVNLLERYYREMSGQHVPFLRHLVALVVYAVALERAGRHDDAIDVLVETLQLTASERIVRPFAQMGEKVAPLVDRYIRERRSSVPRDYIEMIAGACGVHREVLSAHEERVGDQENAGDLTTRELEILQLMSLGYTNQKIADKLYVSINTVKTHASNLFDKLGASNRVDALVRAREARILQS
jgi:LuxR family maltose regulon positive regulatory protein